MEEDENPFTLIPQDAQLPQSSVDANPFEAAAQQAVQGVDLETYINDLRLSTPVPQPLCYQNQPPPMPAAGAKGASRPSVVVNSLNHHVFDENAVQDLEARVQTMNGVIIINLPALVQLVPLVTEGDVCPVTLRLKQYLKRTVDTAQCQMVEDLWYCEVVGPIGIAFLGYESWASRRFWARLTGSSKVAMRFWNNMYDMIHGMDFDFRVPKWIPYANNVVLVRTKFEEFELNVKINPSSARPQLNPNPDEIIANIPEEPETNHPADRKRFEAEKIVVKKLIERVMRSVSPADREERELINAALRMPCSSEHSAVQQAGARLSTLMMSHAAMKELSEFYKSPVSAVADFFKIDPDFDYQSDHPVRPAKPLDTESAMKYINSIVESKIAPLTSQTVQISQQLSFVANAIAALQSTVQRQQSAAEPFSGPSSYGRPPPALRTGRKRHINPDDPDRAKLENAERAIEEMRKVNQEYSDRIRLLESKCEEMGNPAEFQLPDTFEIDNVLMDEMLSVPMNHNIL